MAVKPIWMGNFIDLGSVRIHYLVKGKGFPLLLVHGLGIYSYTWRYNIDELARHYRVYALDLKGFGLSDKPRGRGYSIDHHAATVLQFMDRMGLHQVDYAGSSMGGEIGLRLALRHPERIHRLILIASSGYKDRIPYRLRLLGHLPYLSPLRRWVHRKWMAEETLIRMIKEAYYNPDFISDEEIRNCLFPVFLPGFEEGFLTMLKEFDFGKEKMNYGKIKHRTLILAGESDKTIPLEHCRMLNRDIQHSELVVIPQSGHLLHEEKSAEVNRRILQFLG